MHSSEFHSLFQKSKGGAGAPLNSVKEVLDFFEFLSAIHATPYAMECVQITDDRSFSVPELTFKSSGSEEAELSDKEWAARMVAAVKALPSGSDCKFLVWCK